ncbi:MAG: BRO family protein [Rhizobium sp.]|nr:BRO family protein [Rhizobium sp.]MCZ8351660.1 BRO family protein [Rhizobium sp.]
MVDIDGNPWFVAADVCEALGMDLSAGTSRWVAGVEGADKMRCKRSDLPQLFCGSRAPTINLLSEAGQYKMVMRSNKPDAEAFQDWIARDVLPAIRKDGMYVKGEEKIDLTDDDALDRMTELVLEGLPEKISGSRGASTPDRLGRSSTLHTRTRDCPAPAAYR